ncbi:unnamed protein product [Lactuca virosa]|uniref:Uncharacterized protein n=1 Tax=Lactuca virosa TaxID=75947 RepID=A0AAU9N2F8_9ASTR|nr:unnamed protein product [Lactuca virosa]
MKQSINGGGGGGVCGGRGLKIPSEDEVEVISILINLPNLISKSELLSKYSFTWGRKKKRSVLVSKSESSPSTHRQINESRPEKVKAAEDDKSPSTPLCFLPSGSGSDGAADKPKQHSSSKKHSKRKATNDLIERYHEMQQEREILVKKIKAMENHREELIAQNLELKRKRQEINTRNMDDLHLWNNSMRMNRDQQHYHRQQQQQITMYAPPPAAAPSQLQQHCQQFMVDPNNGKVVAVSCSGNSNNGGRFDFFNQIDARVKIQGETFDFMTPSQPLDQSKYLAMDNDQRVRSAAEARRYRFMRMKENKNSSSAMKLSRGCR